MREMLRAVALTLLFVGLGCAGPAIGPSRAQAAVATVAQCRSVDGNPADLALTTYTDQPSWLNITTCGALFNYMGIASFGERGSNPQQDQKSITMTAPGSTTVAGVRLHRRLANYAYSSDPSQRYYDSWALGYRFVDASGAVLERCGASVIASEGPGQCKNENFTTVLNGEVFSASDLRTKSLSVQFGCYYQTYCGHFYDGPSITDVYADLDISDANAPVVEQVSGPLSSSESAITSANDDVTVSATDHGGLGILGMRASVDGHEIGSTGWAGQSTTCVDRDPGPGFKYLAGQPCSTTPPAMTWSLPPTDDGLHNLELYVVDAAGNESSVLRRQVVLDRVAPVMSQDPAVTGLAKLGSSLSCNLGGVLAQDGVVTYQWVRSRPDGSEAQVISGADKSSYLITQADVAYKLLCRVTVTDRGGSTTRTSSLTSGPFDGGQTVVGGNASTPSGSTPGAAAGTGSTGTSGGTGPAAGNGGTGGGAGDAIGSATVGTSAATAQGPSGLGSVQGPAAPVAGCPVGTLVTLEGSSRLVAKRASSATSVAGVVRSGAGAPAAGVAVDLVQRARRAGTAPVTVASGVSGADGRFSLKAPVGPSRDLQVVTRSCGAAGPVVGQSVRGQLKLRAVNPRVRNGQAVRFSGQALGGYYGKGVGLELQVLVGRKWQDVRAVRTDRSGKFRTSYRFKRTYVRYTYRFRVITRATAGWPYTATRSPVAKVRVN